MLLFFLMPHPYDFFKEVLHAWLERASIRPAIYG